MFRYLERAENTVHLITADVVLHYLEKHIQNPTDASR